MKRLTKVLTLVLVASVLVTFAAGSASAEWLSDATVNYIGVAASGDYELEATGSFTQYLTIDSSGANAKAMLAIIITAKSTGEAVTIEYTGTTLQKVFYLGAGGS